MDADWPIIDLVLVRPIETVDARPLLPHETGCAQASDWHALVTPANS